MKFNKKISLWLLCLVALVTMGAKIQSDSIKFGRKIAENLTIEFDIGSATNPRIFWNNATNKLRFTNNGTTFFDLGSGSGGGGSGINYMANPGFEEGVATLSTYKDAAATAPVDGTGGSSTLAISATTVTAEVIRELQSLKIVKPASNVQGEGVAQSFTIDNADKGKPVSVKVNYVASTNYAACDIRMYLIETTGNNVIGSSDTCIPAGSGEFKSTYFLRSTNSYRVVFHYATTSTATSTIFFDGISVGPDSLTTSAAVGFVSATTSPFTIGAIGGAPPTPATDAAYYTRVDREGSYAIIRYEFSQTNTDGAAGDASVVYTIPFPSGLTPDLGKLAQTGSQESTRQIGSGMISNSVAVPYINASNSVSVALEEGTIWGYNTLALNGAVYLGITVRVPIAQWSDNVYLANTTQMYACNTSVTNANDTSSFQFGESGCRFPNVSSTVKSKDVQYPRPLGPNDIGVIEVSFDSGASWNALGEAANANVTKRVYQNTTSYGMDLEGTKVDAQTLRVMFGEFRSPYSGGTFAGNAAPWSDIDNDPTNLWRVKIVNRAQTVGFNTVGQNASGLVAGAGQLLGTNTNDSACTGCVGERIESIVLSTSPVNLTSGVGAGFQSIVITPGHWNVCAHAFFVASSGSAASRTASGISLTSGVFDGDDAISYASLNSGPSFNLPSTLDAPCKVYKVTTNTTIHHSVLSIYSGGYNEVSGHLYADRIR